MENFLNGKRRSELNINENKDVLIQSIIGIRIHKFRSFEDQSLILGENLTVLSGRNGSMKTSLMGLLAHPFSSDAKDVFGAALKTRLSEVFKLSPEYDKEDYNYDLSIRTVSGETLSEPVRIYRVDVNTHRHRIVVSGAGKGDGNFSYNTSFLNLKRLYPLVNTRAEPTTDQTIQLSQDEISDLKDFYETVFPSSEYESFVPVHDKSIKSTFALSGESARYNWESISSGEDNLGAIFNRLIGFQRAIIQKSDAGNGILCIDEFESSLHPVAQLRLLDYLYKWSQKHKVQIVISTHSLHLIQYLYLSHLENIKSSRIIINFISKSSAKDGNFPILKNPDYGLAYKELTFTDPEKIVSARKLKIFCEDECAVHFVKKIIKTQKILSTIDFHSSMDPEGGKIGTSWTSLRQLCIQFPLLLEGSLAIFDADVGDHELKKIKNKDLYLVLPDPNNLAIERRIIIFIISLDNDDGFFKKFRKEREIFLSEFKDAQIKSLTPEDISNAEKTKIEKCKAWANKNKSLFKQYITYYTENSGVRDDFRILLINRINKINSQHGLPLIPTD